MPIDFIMEGPLGDQPMMRYNKDRLFRPYYSAFVDGNYVDSHDQENGNVIEVENPYNQDILCR